MLRISVLFLLLTSFFSEAQKLPAIEEKTAGLKKQEGFINFYWDENTGKLWLDINKLDSEFLYTTARFSALSVVTAR